MELEAKIEGLLFYKGEEMTIKEMAKLFGVSEEEVSIALSRLEGSLKNRGLMLMRKADTVMLGVAKELSPLIESIRKEELTKDLSKASLETLSIILYKTDIPRSEIDYIRGVNSSFIIRNLLIRGLIEKTIDPKDSRRMLYKPTFDLMSFMGVRSLEELPNYQSVRNQLDEVVKGNTENSEKDDQRS